MVDLKIIIIIAFILALAITYIVVKKKKGAKCIGCPYANSCSSQSAGCSCNK